jgi:hypothetical protein
LESDGTPDRERSPKKPATIDVDWIASAAAHHAMTVPRPAAIGAGVVAILGFLMLLSPAVPRLSLIETVRTMDLVGFALVLFVAMPAHEAAHALAARLAGIPAGGLGVRFRPFGIPRPYIYTAQIYRVSDSVKRCLIPLAGPITDLVVGGVAAWAMYFFPDPRINVLVMFSIVSVTIGTSPLLEGDGSHAIEAFLGDATLRKAALLNKRGAFTSGPDVRRYRAITALHAMLSMAVVLRIAR